MEFVVGGVAACCAGVITNPLEVVKTRLQLQGELRSRGRYTVYYRNAFHAFYAVAKADGLFALQKGLVPALWYQLFMNGIRLGTFDCIEKCGLTRNKSGEISFWKSISAGAVSGCVGAIVGSPFYMIKTQLQAQSSGAVAVGYQHHHHSMTQALRYVYEQHGVFALWRGVSAAMLRVTCGSAAQLSTFSKAKSLMEKTHIFPPDSWLNALAASMLSGVVVVACMTPLDVVSTRLYNQGIDARGKGLLYVGTTDCLLKIFQTEGLMGFYKGCTANLLRLGPHTVLSLVFWNELRKLNHFYEQDKIGLHNA